MYIDFNKYPTYSGAISENVETNINDQIWCQHGFPYSTIKGNMLTYIYNKSWQMMKSLFLRLIK